MVEAKFHDGIGALAECVEVPKMRGRKGLSKRRIIALLQESLKELCNTPCCFWACAGPNRPQNMITCSRCWALRDLASAIASLEKADLVDPKTWGRLAVSS